MIARSSLWRSSLTKLAGRLRRRRHLMGAMWSSVNAGAGVLLPFAIFVFFARALPPAQIGLVVLATSCAEIVKALGLPGLYEALLQQDDDRQRCHETALALLLLTGFVLLPVFAGVIAILGHLVDGIAAHRLALDLVGLRILFDLATLQPQAALAQRLSYRRMAVRSIVANAIAGAIGIFLAFAGAPMAGLITYQIGQSALILLTTAVGTGALARPRLHRDALRRMAREATMASVVRLVAATNNYFDQIVVATVLSSTRLAYFNLAKRVEATFITTASSFSSILFQPLFAARAATGATQVLRNGLATLTLLCGLPTAFLAVNGTHVVTLVFGARWSTAAPVVAILAASGLVRALGSVHGALLSVSGRNRELAMMSAVSAISGVVVVFPAAMFGIVWCAAALALKNLAITLWLAYATRRAVPHMAEAYLADVGLPLALMLLGAVAGRLLVDATLPVTHPTDTLTALTASALVGGLCGLAYLARRFLRATPQPVSLGG